jgi:hypothetical protein
MESVKSKLRNHITTLAMHSDSDIQTDRLYSHRLTRFIGGHCIAIRLASIMGLPIFWTVSFALCGPCVLCGTLLFSLTFGLRPGLA